MGKKSKDDAAASSKKEAKVKAPKTKQPKVKAPLDPVKTKNLIHLLNILALLLAIAAFLLQLFAVASHHWKWQKINLHSIVSPNNDGHVQVAGDSNLYQDFGLFSREVKVFSNNDEKLEVLGSTRFPRLDEGEQALQQCFSQTTGLRGALLACSKQIISPNQCNCRRHPYWNAVIFFEVAALILLGIVVFLVALLSTQFHKLLKPAAAGLALLAFLFLFIGLILILSYRKRETRSFADAFPYIYHRLVAKLGTSDKLRRAIVRRDIKETYKAYSLLPGQYPYNETHFYEYSEEAKTWIHKPYSSLNPPVLMPEELSGGKSNVGAPAPAPENTDDSDVVRRDHVIGYNEVFDRSDAGIGWSTWLSILALLLSLILPLILIFSWLQNKNLESDPKKSVTGKVEYSPVSQEITAEAVPLKPIPTEYNAQRPIADAIVTTQNAGPPVNVTYNTGVPEPVIVRDVVIGSGDQASPVIIDTTQPVANV